MQLRIWHLRNLCVLGGAIRKRRRNSLKVHRTYESVVPGKHSRQSREIRVSEFCQFLDIKLTDPVGCRLCEIARAPSVQWDQLFHSNHNF